MKVLLRRLGIYAVTAWVAVTITFILPRLMPGNPVDVILGNMQGRKTPAMVKAIKAQFGQGLSEPPLVQYYHYILQLLHGNLGKSFDYYPTTVSSMMGAHIFWTIGLIGTATIISFIIGTLLGVVFGWTRGSRFDSVIPIATFFQSIPYYILGTIMILYLAVQLHWFPLEGSYGYDVTSGWNWAYIASVIRYAELPLLAIVISSLAGWMLGMRNMMITTVGEDFVLMAVAKGLPRRRVIYHAARNAILPSVSNFALTIGLLVSGALVVEQVFSYQGIGFLVLNAVSNEDYPVIQGIFLLVTFTVLAANFLADIAYFILDPRTRTVAAH